MNQDNRTDKRNRTRLHYSFKGYLFNEFFGIKLKTVDVSKMGLGVLVNGTVPFENGDKLFVHIKNRFSPIQVRWTEKVVTYNATRLGLKLFSNLTLHF